MNAAIGFTAIANGSDLQKAGAAAALQRALKSFPEIKQHSVQVHSTTLHLWGRGELEECTHRLADGSMLVLIGSPLGNYSWQEVEKQLSTVPSPQDFRLPWDGRVILLHLHAEGDCWTLWNDWMGSIPVFHAEDAQRRIASTLEPVVVSANRYRGNDFFLPGILALLIQGNLLSDWTIFKDMKVVPPDSVCAWDESRFHTQSCGTIQATDARWEYGWDDLVDEMHQLSEKAILDVLKTQPNWTVPLSSGLDSRLVAAVGAKAGANLRTYTWGPSTTRDVIYSRRIAKTLGLPWKQIDLGENYLAEHVQQWSVLFGSAMHFHGMYQIPFLNALRSEPAGKIISGFIGECLSGYDVIFNTKYHQLNRRVYSATASAYQHWDGPGLKKLLKIPVDDALEQFADEIQRLKNDLSGPWFQRLRLFTLWGRQNHFTYFQSMLSEYWHGVATPYINRDLARFGLSLPRAALDDRLLQIEMMRRFYGNVMCVPGTYAAQPAIVTGRYLLSRRLSETLPHPLSRRLFPEFSAQKNIKTDVVNMRSGADRAIWPIRQAQNPLAEWMDTGLIDQTYRSAINGDMTSVRRIQSIQTIAYRLLETSES
jgi:hypothetical protein